MYRKLYLEYKNKNGSTIRRHLWIEDVDSSLSSTTHCLVAKLGRLGCFLLSVELSYVGTMAFGSLPSFEQFAAQHAPTHGGASRHATISRASSSDQLLSALGNEAISELHTSGKVIERRVIGWQESVSRKTGSTTWGRTELPVSQPEAEDTAPENTVPEDPPSINPVSSPRESAEDQGSTADEEQDAGLPNVDEFEPESVPMAASPVNEPKSTTQRIFTYTQSQMNALGRIYTTPYDGSGDVNYESPQIFRRRRVAPLGYDFENKVVSIALEMSSNAHDIAHKINMRFTLSIYRPSILKNPVLYNPAEEHTRRHATMPVSEQTMLIMAYFGSPQVTTYEPSDEYLLCQVTVVNDRVIRFLPDLGSHMIKTRHGNYSVTIRVVESEKPLEFDALADRLDESLRIPGSGKDDEKEQTDGHKYALFDLPEPHIHWIHYLIHIEEGINFPHDGLFVEYLVELPSNVEILEKERITGRSQICFTKSEGLDDVARFSFPIQLTLAYSTFRRQHGEVITWPRILLRVVSEDDWHRFYVDGYASIGLPIQPGHHNDVSVECWRVVNPFSHRATMQEMFLGQDVDLKFFELAGSRDGNNQWSKIYSKVGLCTETSGTVKLSIQCLHQNRQYIDRSVLRSLKYGSLMQKIGMSGSMHWRIVKVLNEFENARQKLLRLRTKKMPLMKTKPIDNLLAK
ncbi:ciliary basal body-associated, b9 protein domain-containing protein [Ditylenchus destructor]|uniref:Ciliary basal body-associated, b9 protein domain-containing protein n=1 Tax=Ditylenchus destructor TaxID=166010 RepID=A0AAD4R7C6_9BILA|nr:ciliary basal body-associated, b9 protein domain-containing protein [Ditylenchus destructor]